MGSRFVRELTAADAMTLTNAIIGFLAVIMAPTDHELAARLILLAAVTDGLDGVLARRFGGSDVGPYLDSLADVASFAIAPAVLVYVFVSDLSIAGVPEALEPLLLAALPALFVSLAVLRLGVYSTYDTKSSTTIGAPTTLGATILGAVLLTGLASQPLVVVGTGILAILMVSPIGYPDLLARDAIIMGVIHVLAVLFPAFYGRVFPYALVTLAVAYLVLAPSFYWGESERLLREPPSAKGKRS